jgi:hypothetical protein
MKILIRVILFILLFGIPAIFLWWLYFPLAIAYTYKVKNPYEILLASSILDRAYFSGNTWYAGHEMFIFSVLLLAVIMMLVSTFEWERPL